MSHWYDKQGKLVRPGTGMISPTTALDVRRNPGLQGWKDFVGPIESERVSQLSRVDGTAVHEAIEAILNDKMLPIPDNAAPYVHGFLKWEEKYKPTDIETEVFVYSDEFGYAGTLDLLCKIDGEWWIKDWKTSKSFHPSMGLQLVAYQNALKERRGIEAKTGIVQLTCDTKKGYRDKQFDEPLEVFVAHVQIALWEQEVDPVEEIWDGGVIYA